MTKLLRKKQPAIINRIQSVVLLLSMAALLSLLGWFIAGVAGAKTAVIVTILAFIFTPRLPAHLVMKSLRARPLNPRVASGLYRIAGRLAQNARLERMPALYYLPSAKLNAFAVGNKKDSAIAVTHGLLNALTTREMAGILAHEITHIKNNDVRVMALSAVFGRITNYLALAGQVLLLVSLPLAIAGQAAVSLLPLGIMVFAPILSMLLYLALSRTREYEADMGSLTLLKDPEALVSALSKVEAVNTRPWHRYFTPMPRQSGQAPLLLSHPPTRERIKRLRAVSPQRATPPSYNRPPRRRVMVL